MEAKSKSEQRIKMFMSRCGFQQHTNDMKMQKTKKIINYHSKSGGKTQFIFH